MEPLLPKHILIVDDCEDSLQLLKTLLEHKHFEVTCASNGSEALKLLGVMDFLPHLILLDANMPIMNGYEFRVIQKADERLCHIPVVVMSGSSAADIDIRMLQPESIMQKPLRISHLMENVASFI